MPLRRFVCACFFIIMITSSARAETPAADVFSLFESATVTPQITAAPTFSPSPAPTIEAEPSGFTLTVISEDSAPRSEAFRVLIYHTHTYEAYTATEKMAYTPTEKWRTADQNRNVVAVGARLAQLLENAGLSVTHDQGAYEPPTLSQAYERSLKMLTDRAANGESYDLYIDLHRDAYAKNNGPNTVEHEGETLARLLFLVGKGTGQTSAGYAEKPDFERNRAIAQALTNRLNLQCEGLCRSVSVKSGRYNQHVAPCCVLVEVGNNYNTLEEALAAMPYLANAICALADGQIE